MAGNVLSEDVLAGNNSSEDGLAGNNSIENNLDTNADTSGQELPGTITASHRRGRGGGRGGRGSRGRATAQPDQRQDQAKFEDISTKDIQFTAKLPFTPNRSVGVHLPVGVTDTSEETLFGLFFDAVVVQEICKCQLLHPFQGDKSHK